MKAELGSRMSRGEILGGILFIPFYLIILPFIVTVAVIFLGEKYSFSFDSTLIMLVNYYIAFAIAVVMFRKFLKSSLSTFVHNLMGSFVSVILCGIVIYVLSFVISVIFVYFLSGVSNPNDVEVYGMFIDHPRETIVMSVFLVPIIEETLFRGLIFGGLLRKSRFLAYAVSFLAFSFLHVWQYAVAAGDWTLLIVMVQYLPSSIGLAWCYERSGTIWASVLLHMLNNGAALAVLYL